MRSTAHLMGRPFENVVAVRPSRGRHVIALHQTRVRFLLRHLCEQLYNAPAVRAY